VLHHSRHGCRCQSPAEEDLLYSRIHSNISHYSHVYLHRNSRLGVRSVKQSTFSPRLQTEQWVVPPRCQLTKHTTAGLVISTHNGYILSFAICFGLFNGHILVITYVDGTSDTYRPLLKIALRNGAFKKIAIFGWSVNWMCAIRENYLSEGAFHL
jgi:hypothetical protein